MSAELVPVGFKNFIALNRVIAIVSTGSAPIQRLVRDGKKKGTIIDITNGRRTKAAIFMDSGHIILTAITSGRRTKAAIFMDSGHIILTAITPETISGRVVTAGHEGVYAKVGQEGNF